jgi:hypothetical protein
MDTFETYQSSWTVWHGVLQLPDLLHTAAKRDKLSDGVVKFNG